MVAPGPAADPLGLERTFVHDYYLEAYVASGGFGVVYRGWRREQNKKLSVAIKVLRVDGLDPGVAQVVTQHFVKEASVLAGLTHEHIPKIFASGKHLCPDNVTRHYIVQEWIDGRSLETEFEERKRREKPYTISEILRLLDPIADALSCVHAKDIVHRDVTPRNILLRSGSRRPVLIDFGFAKILPQGVPAPGHPATVLAVSPDYATPEHVARATYGELSPKTDLYALALILVESMTLEPPLGTRDRIPAAAATLSPDTRPTPRTRGVEVSDHVERLFQRALALRQEDRPRSLSRWWKDLRRAASLGRKWWAALAFVVSAGSVLAAYLLWYNRCTAATRDCNGNRWDGCETSIVANRLHCGECGHACAPGVACTNGVCRPPCPANMRDCNGRAEDGCETDISTVEHCGSCETSCGMTNVVTARCVRLSVADARTKPEWNCTLDCARPYDDCDSNPRNGCEANLATEAKNCGECRHACEGAAPCAEGICDGFALTPPGSWGALATTANGLAYLQLETDAEPGAIWKMDPTQPGSASVVTKLHGVARFLAANDTRTCWSIPDRDSGRVECQTWSDGTNQIIRNGHPWPTDLAFDKAGNRLVWTTWKEGEFGAGEVWRYRFDLPAGEGNPQRLAPREKAPWGITVDGDQAIWGNCTKESSTLNAVGLDEGLNPNPRNVANLTRCLNVGELERIRLRSDGTHVYWLASGGPDQPRPGLADGGPDQPRPGLADGGPDQPRPALWRMVVPRDKDGRWKAGGKGDVQQLGAVATTADPRAIVVDETHVYWGEGDGSIHRIDKSSKGAETIATTPNGKAVRQVAVDRERIYWTSENQIYSARKPRPVAPPRAVGSTTAWRRSAETANFRRALKIGDESHCGVVVEVRHPVAKVQAMIGEVWLKVEQLHPKGYEKCRFFNNVYVDP